MWSCFDWISNFVLRYLTSYSIHADKAYSGTLFSASDVSCFDRDCVLPRRHPMNRQRLRAYRLARFIIFRGRVIVLVHLCPDGIHRDGERYSASHSGGWWKVYTVNERLNHAAIQINLFLLFNDVGNVSLPSWFFMDRVRKAFEHPLLILNRRRCVYPFVMLLPS